MPLESPTLPPAGRVWFLVETDPPTPVEALKSALDRSQMTREDFARKILGVDPSTVYRWLHGRPIPLTVQDRITHYLTEGI